MPGADHELPRPDHVVHRNQLGDADRQLDPSGGRLHDRVRRERRRNEDPGDVRPGRRNSIGDGVEDRYAVLVVPPLPGETPATMFVPKARICPV